MKQRVRLAVIGAWGHLNVPLAELATLPEIEPVGIAPGPGGDDIGALCKRFPYLQNAPVFADHRRMLQEARPNLVIISTRLDQIAPLATEAADAGCHLICEKPLALTRSALAALRSRLASAGLHCHAMLHNRAHPVLAAAMDFIGSGALGKPALINTRKSYRWGKRPAWFAQRETYGGTIPWVGIHAVDFIHALAQQEFTAVTAMQSNLLHPDYPGCEDHCAVIFALSGGTHATASIDFLRPLSAKTHGDDWIRVVGSEGVLEASLDEGWCRVLGSAAAPQDLPIGQAKPIYRPLVEAIAGGADIGFEETERSLMLTDVSLWARDSADAATVSRRS